MAAKKKAFDWNEYIEIIVDPYRGGKLVGKRGVISGWQSPDHRPVLFHVKIDGIRQEMFFTRRQLASTGVQIYPVPGNVLSADQIVSIILNPPKQVRYDSLLRRYAPTKELINLLRSSPHSWVRYHACYTLGMKCRMSAREAILEALFDEDKDVRYCAADMYAKVGRPEDGPIVMAAYRLEKVRQVRTYLLIAFGAIRYQAAAPLLLSVIDDPGYASSAAWSLSQLDGPEVAEGLRKALERWTFPASTTYLEGIIAKVEARIANPPHPRIRKPGNPVDDEGY